MLMWHFQQTYNDEILKQVKLHMDSYTEIVLYVNYLCFKASENDKI